MSEPYKSQKFLTKLLTTDIFNGLSDREKKATRLEAAYKTVFSNDSDSAKLVMQDLCKQSGFYSSNPTADAFLEGKRALFLHVLKKIAND